YQQETLPVEKRRGKGLKPVWQDLSAVLTHPHSRRYIIMSCVATGIILTFLSHAPLIYHNFGTSVGGFSVLFAVTSIGIVLGQIINHRLLAIMSSQRATVIAAVVVATTAIAIWVCAYTNNLSAYLFTALMFAFNMSYLIIFSNLVSMTLEPHGARAGMASAMFGFCSYIGGSVISAVLAFITNQETLRWAFWFMLLSVLLLFGLLNILRLNRSESHPG
ncbi:MAG: MFS transporter, partial [Pseudomonadota bacterium]